MRRRFYEAGVLGPGAAATVNVPYAALWNPASVEFRVWEIGDTNTSGTTNSFLGLKRTSARGTQTATTLGNPADPGDTAAQGTVDTAWSANPTVTGSLLTQGVHTTQQGPFILWHWWGTRDGLVIPAGAGLALVQIQAVTAGQSQETWWVWSE